MTAPRLDLELTQSCDHRCAHCYNVWGAQEGDAQHKKKRPPLPTAELKRVLAKAIEQSGAEHLTVTGGEPLLHRDALDILAFARPKTRTLGLITNGAHVPPETARRLGEIGITSVQLTLLAGAREQHDRLKGAPGSFDATLRAVLDLQDAGVRVRACFVATRDNADQFRPVLELCLVLGIKGLSYNRMSPAGGSIHELDRLLPTIEQVERDLDTAEHLGRAWNIGVATAMPIPPCLIRTERYSWVRMGFCSTGTQQPNYVIGPGGDVRACNLSSEVLGNLVESDWDVIADNAYPQTFRTTVPDVCKPCHYRMSCIGGCKESAFAVFGDHAHPDPFVWQAILGETGAG